MAGPELLDAVERVAGGELVDPGQCLAVPLETLRASSRLTEREMEIVQLVASGLSNRDIAERLYLSINSIKTYIRTAYRKIGVDSRSGAVLWAVHHHLVQPVRPRHVADAAEEDDGD